MNWKLVMDTFTEPYHIPWLHKDSIAPYYLFDRWIHDSYGRHPTLHRLPQVGPRGVRQTPARTTGSCSRTGRFSTCSSPNAVLVHQMDHLELWRLQAVGPGSHARAHVRLLATPIRPRPGPSTTSRTWTSCSASPTPRTSRCRSRCSATWPRAPCRSWSTGRWSPPSTAYHQAINERLAATTSIR